MKELTRYINEKLDINKINLDSFPIDGTLDESVCKNVENKVTDFANAIVDIGGALTKYVTVPLTALGGVSIKNFTEEFLCSGILRMIKQLIRSAGFSYDSAIHKQHTV